MATWPTRARRGAAALTSTACMLLAATTLVGPATATHTTQVGPITIEPQHRIELPAPAPATRIVWEVTFHCNDAPVGTHVEFVGGEHLYQIRGQDIHDDDWVSLFGWGESGYCNGQDTLLLRVFVDSEANTLPNGRTRSLLPGPAFAYADVAVQFPDGQVGGAALRETVLLAPHTP